jgi:uncharacterized protein YecT (DUF1311 family)
MRTLLALIPIAFAAGARANECGAPRDQTTMNACAGEAYRKSDAELNAVYKKLQNRNKHDYEAGKLLIAAERGRPFRSTAAKLAKNRYGPRSVSQLHGPYFHLLPDQTPYGTSGARVIIVAKTIAVHSPMPMLRSIAM